MSAPSLQPGQFDTNLRHQIEKEGGWAALGLDYTAIMNSFPVGAVWLWADEATIPSGWAIADEAAHRFLLAGESGDTPWGQGGSPTHTHDNHDPLVFTQPSDHVGSTGPPSVVISVTDDGTSQVTVAANNHAHVVGLTDHADGDVSDPSAHSVVSNAPEYFILFVIVKVS